ncbi:tRNA isopentenyl-2-thiomethyl-A-37 hydroxylase MiaE [Litorivivens lipolytica]|uniref:tRNA isopentenyl-2-thiomethyl-A-37 hydroxylase MiaE n=1 Tax=Litorivivens lipolytica TaxID=1524264 RepID=UPI001617F021
MITLRYQTPSEWTETVLADFDHFLLDHAAAEKKAAGMAISMASHYPDKPELVEAMAELAVEEMSHYREVVKLIHSRGGLTAADERDPYVNQLRKHLRKGSEAYFLDRLLLGGVIEARGAERFGLIADAAEDGPIKRFYTSISRSEERHRTLFTDLAHRYFPADTVVQRLDEWLKLEAEIAARQPIRAALH